MQCFSALAAGKLRLGTRFLKLAYEQLKALSASKASASKTKVVKVQSVKSAGNTTSAALKAPVVVRSSQPKRATVKTSTAANKTTITTSNSKKAF